MQVLMLLLANAYVAIALACRWVPACSQRQRTSNRSMQWPQWPTHHRPAHSFSYSYSCSHSNSHSHSHSHAHANSHTPSAQPQAQSQPRAHSQTAPAPAAAHSGLRATIGEDEHENEDEADEVDEDGSSASARPAAAGSESFTQPLPLPISDAVPLPHPGSSTSVYASDHRSSPALPPATNASAASSRRRHARTYPYTPAIALSLDGGARGARPTAELELELDHNALSSLPGYEYSEPIVLDSCPGPGSGPSIDPSNISTGLHSSTSSGFSLALPISSTATCTPSTTSSYFP